GPAGFVLPATGHVGLHIVEIQHSDFGSPYRNTQQSPVAGRPDFKLRFTIQPVAPLLPASPERPATQAVPSLPVAGALVATPAFSGIGEPAVVRGKGFESGRTYQ